MPTPDNPTEGFVPATAVCHRDGCMNKDLPLGVLVPPAEEDRFVICGACGATSVDADTPVTYSLTAN